MDSTDKLDGYEQFGESMRRLVDDKVAPHAAGRAFAHIERAFADGADLEARWHILMAAVQGRVTFQNGLGAMHSIAVPPTPSSCPPICERWE